MTTTYDTWRKASDVADQAKKVLHSMETLDKLAGDVPSTKLLAAMKRVVEHYNTARSVARDANIEFASQRIPEDIRTAGEEIARRVSERLVDPSKLVHFPWVTIYGHQIHFAYTAYVEDKAYGLRQTRFDVTRSYSGTGLMCESLTATEKTEEFIDAAVSNVCKSLRGWSGLKGEDDRNSARAAILDKIAPILLNTCRGLNRYRSDALSQRKDTTTASCDFRQDRLEDLSEHDRYDEIDAVNKKAVETLKSALGPLMDHVKNICCDYGEKGWYEIVVEVN